MTITDVVIITTIMVRLSPSHYFLNTQGKKERASIWINKLWTMSFYLLMEWNSRKRAQWETWEKALWRQVLEGTRRCRQESQTDGSGGHPFFKKWVKNMFGQWKIACCFSLLSKEREVRKEILCSNRNGGTMRALTRPAVCKKGMLEEVEKSCLCKKARNYRARM